MKRKVIICTVFAVGIWLFFSTLILTSVNDAEDWANAIRVIIYGGAVTSLLFIAIGAAFAYLITELKEISQSILAIITTIFIVCSLIIIRFGSLLVVAKEGWLNLYKHPFVWILLALLITDFVLYLFKANNSTKAP